MTADDERRNNTAFQPSFATPAKGAAEPPPFPLRPAGDVREYFFADWQQRLSRNLSRRSDGRWEPLSYWR
jgi:hypothetical protein